MKRKDFINRNRELASLNKLWSDKDFSLVIVYGRRRVGKTRLLLEFSKGKKSIYYISVEAPYEIICSEFSDRTKDVLNLPISGDIIDILDAITKLSKEKMLVILDEFQYIVDSDPSFPSRLQRAIDEKLGYSKLMLVLCGSAVSFFERKLLGYKSPIFGRREMSIKLKPLSFLDISGFFPGYSIEDLIKIYSIVGGTPAYLEKIDPEASVVDNIRSIIIPGSYLYDEALNILRQEVREPRVYFTILRSVAEGHTSPSEVANIAKVDTRSINRYLWLLEDLDIVRRIRPLGFKKPVRIVFVDNYFRFWFTYVYKLRSMLEVGYIDEAYKYIKDTFNQYLSRVFEDLIIEIVPHLYNKRIIRTRPVEIGKWWYKDIEIDGIVREPGKSTTFIEGKWREINAEDAMRILRDLEMKSAKTGLTSPVNYFVLIAKIVRNKNELQLDENRLVLDLRDIENILFH